MCRALTWSHPSLSIIAQGLRISGKLKLGTEYGPSKGAYTSDQSLQAWDIKPHCNTNQQSLPRVGITLAMYCQLTAVFWASEALLSEWWAPSRHTCLIWAISSSRTLGTSSRLNSQPIDPSTHCRPSNPQATASENCIDQNEPLHGTTTQPAYNQHHAGIRAGKAARMATTVCEQLAQRYCGSSAPLLAQAEIAVAVPTWQRCVGHGYRGCRAEAACSCLSLLRSFTCTHKVSWEAREQCTHAS